MQGLMQHGALTVDKVLDHAKAWHGHREIVSRSVEGPILRTTYAQMHERARKVSNALLGLGVQPGDRVGTLAWNTARHMEAWYGIAGIGAVYHTLNPRLHPDQLAWIINHAEDTVIFADACFAPLLEGVLSNCPTVRHVILTTDAAHMPGFKITPVPAMNFRGVLEYESLIAAQSSDVVWGGFDEETACGLCYTSGTTGDPKGVLYSHRSNTLHTFLALQADSMGLSALDTVLAIVPMFHANAWGLAFSCPAVGAKLVMPGQKLDGASVYELIETEGVTMSAAVPTVWQGLLTHLRAKNLTLPKLKKVVIGGSACPPALIRAFHEDYGVEVVHAWGMTETSPLGTLATMTPELAGLSFEEQLPYRIKQGRPPMGVELKLVDEEGRKLPWDGTTYGKLMVRGPIIAKGYFKGAGGHILDEEGFFDTGDMATIDTHGFMQITDRAKDVIKSGGEWISSIDIENIAMGHPAVELAAVVGVAHPKWDERPLLMVKLKPGATATKEDMIRFQEGKIARWWMPDDVMFVDDIPLGPTGKIDKKVLRARLGDYHLPETPIAATLAAVAVPAAAAAAAIVALAGERPPRLVAEEPEHPPEPEPVAEPAPEPVAQVVVEPAPEPEAVAVPEPVAAEPVAPPAEPEPAAVAPEAAAPEPVAPEPVPPEPTAPVQSILNQAMAWAPAPSPMKPAAAPESEVPPPPAPAAPVVKPSEIGAALSGLAAVSAVLGLAAKARAEAPAPHPTIFALEKQGHVEVMPPPPSADHGHLPEPLPNMPGATPVGEDAAGTAPPAEAVAETPAEAATEPRAVPAPTSIPVFKPLADLEAALAAGEIVEVAKPEPEPLTLAPPAAAPGGEPLAFAFTPTIPEGRTRAKSRAKKGQGTGLAGAYLTFAVLLSLVPAVLVAGGAAATRLGLIGWQQGFTAVLQHGPTPQMGWAPAVAGVSLAVSLIGVFVAMFSGGRLWGRALLALAISVVSLGGFFALSNGAAHIPPIHEVATDWNEPIMFSDATLKTRTEAGAQVPIEPNPVLPIGSSNYSGRRLADINAETCPGAQPVMLGVPVGQAFEMAREALVRSGVQVTVQDSEAGRLEGVATTLIYGFKDDIAVRVKPVAAGARVDVRSISRAALSDLGQNCRRVTSLMGKLQG